MARDLNFTGHQWLQIAFASLWVIQLVAGGLYGFFVMKDRWTLAYVVVVLLPVNIAMYQAWRSKRRRPEDADLVALFKERKPPEDTKVG